MAAASGVGVGVLSSADRTWGRGDDADKLDRGVLRERTERRDAERAAAQEDRPGAGHARADAASRTSSSSPSPPPTSMSSSIESR